MPETRNTARRRLRSARPKRLRLLNEKNIDRRTRAAKAFAEISRGIVSDLGGPENLTTVERQLVLAFSGAVINIRDLNARLLTGEDVDIIEHSAVISSLCRLASRIGTGRRAREITPNLNRYLAERYGDSDEADDGAVEIESESRAAETEHLE